MHTVISIRTVWWALTAVLVAVALRLWHAVLMKEALDRPIILVGWIACAWVFIAISTVCERRGAQAGIAGMPSLWSRRSASFWSMLAVFSALLLLFHVGFMRAASDGRGYFAQLHSMVIDRDLDFANNIESFAARAADADYPLGTAVMWAPFFLLAHGWLWVLNLFGADYARDGYWNPYQRAVGLGTLAYGFAALVMIGNVLRRYFDGATSLVAASTVLMATPVVWYVAVDSSMSHGASLFAVTSFLVACLATREGRSRRQWWLIGGLAALMVTVRAQNALFLAVLGIEALQVLWKEWRTRSDAGRTLRTAVSYAIPAGVVLLLIVFILGSSGSGGGSDPYVARFGLFSRWRVMDQLFSPHHGLISSSPALAFALLGLPLAYRRDRVLVVGLLAAVVAQVLVNGTSTDWQAGASFGARRFVECALPFALGMAAAVDFARRRGPLVPVSLLLGGLIAVNMALVQDVRRGVLTLSDRVSFDRMAQAVSSRVGNPIALPAATMFAWQHDLPIAHYDRMPRTGGTLRVNVGTDGDSGLLVGGWHGRERDGRGTFRWATEPEAIVVARLSQGSYRLHFTAEPFTWPGAPVQTVEVRIGRTSVATLRLPPAFLEHELDLPEELTPPGAIVRLSFRFGYAHSPRDVGLSDDPRRLAVRFAAIEAIPR
jgi:hypothetical protein